MIDALIDSVELPPDGRILEAGCGTGGNLGVLSRRGTIAAFEPHVDALALARLQHPELDIRQGELPQQLPYDVRSFDLVAALDVLEHVEDDAACSQALAEMVRPGGWLLVTVPAHQALWGSHDRRLHHRRRYGRAELMGLLEPTDLVLHRVTAFNALLAPIAVAYRVGERTLGLDLGNQERVPPRLVNWALSALFAMESRLLRRRIPIPFGLSYAALYQRPIDMNVSA